MIRFPQDDEKLVAFVRRHRPVPPPAAMGLEQQLMQRVEKEAIDCHKTAKIRFLIPATCAAALIFAGGVHNWFAQQHQLQFTVRSQDQELETFLRESWQGTVGEVVNPSYPVSREASWLTLAYLPAKSSTNSVIRP